MNALITLPDVNSAKSRRPRKTHFFRAKTYNEDGESTGSVMRSCLAPRMSGAAFSPSALRNLRAQIMGACALEQVPNGKNRFKTVSRNRIEIHGVINEQIHTLVGQCRAAGCDIAGVRSSIAWRVIDEDDRLDGEDIMDLDLSR